MAAEVSSSMVRRVLSGHIEEQPQIHAGNSDILITKDLLGSLSKAAAATKEIDLEFKPWKLQTQKCSSLKSPLPAAASNSSPDGKNKNLLANSIQDSKLQDLNFPPINLFEDLDLKLQSSTPCHYQSVCTLDNVKYALERAEKEAMRKRSSSSPAAAAEPEAETAASLPATSSSSSTSPAMFAAACPGCLLYVIASKTNPRCPSCNSIVPSAMAVKKPRIIDLNASF